ncbi:interactor of HORMAD1 protein 1 [Pelobates fuscus]|uniref:interactor of HORMAD1 protein 1 n=1 Tax=Pelobates fuscus TaxID=191477 RepID=UPI002FE476E6
MNLNVWNIKDLFSIPPGTGTSKSSGKNSTGDQSSLTDSQFLFSSQFCPDNSQPSLAEYKQPRNSQQNSEDNEPSVFLKYLAKPSLYNDLKENSSFQLFGTEKNKTILEQFEESKKKTKEKSENDQLNNMISNTLLTIQELKVAFCQTEENTNLKCKSILESVETLSKTLQESAASHCNSIIKAFSAKCNVEKAMLELEQKLHKNDEELASLKCNVQLILSNMDILKSQQYEQQVMLSEKIGCLSDSIKSTENKILSELEKTNFAPQLACCLKENTTQTTPPVFSNISFKKQINQFRAKETCQEVSPVSKISGQCPCNVNSNMISADLVGNVNATVSAAAQKFLNVKSMNCVEKFASGCEYSPVSQGGSEKPNPAASDPFQVLAVEKENILCKTIPKHIHTSQLEKEQENYLDISSIQNRLNIGYSCSEENSLLNNKARESVRCQKRRTTNKHKVLSQKKQSECSKKNNKGTVARTSYVRAAKKSGSSEWVNPVINSQQENFTFHSESLVPSLPVIHAPVRKAQKKTRDKFSLLYSHQTARQHSSSNLYSSGDRVSSYKTEHVHWNFSTQESNIAHYSIKNENPMAWLCPSSPLQDNITYNSHLQEEEDNVITLFFDSSDEY